MTSELHFDTRSGADGGYCLACGVEVTQCRCPELPVEYPGVPESEVPLEARCENCGGYQSDHDSGLVYRDFTGATGGCSGFERVTPQQGSERR